MMDRLKTWALCRLVRWWCVGRYRADEETYVAIGRRLKQEAGGEGWMVGDLLHRSLCNGKFSEPEVDWRP